VLRPLPDLPPRVIGFEAVGEVHADDYRDVLRPALDQAAVNGEIRLVYVLGEHFTGYSPGADWEDLKLAFQHVRSWERTAVVTDVDWIDHAVHTFGWMAPGQVRVFPVADLEGAVQWVADLGPEFAGLVPHHDEVVPVDGHGVAAADDVEPAGSPGPDDDDGAPEPEADLDRPALAAETGPTPPTPVVVGGSEQTAVVPPVEAERPEATEQHAAVTGAGGAAPRTRGEGAATVPEQWAPDPTGRHQYRWWNGSEWTEHVADDGRNSVDPIR